MDNQLITASKVISLAFPGCDYTPVELVTSASIESAQRRFLLPVLGEELIAALLDGSYEELLEEYVEPAMAEYTRVEMTPLDDPHRRDILRQARLLTRRLSDHLEDNQGLYAEYKSEHNVLKKIKIYGATIKHH